MRCASGNECSSWPTVTANEDSYRIGGDSQQSRCLSAMARRGEMSGPAAPDNHNTHGSHPGSWATPRAEMDSGAHRGKPDTLHSQMKAWPTVCAGDYRTPPTNSGLQGQQMMPSSEHALPKAAGGKLNPRWVCVLMNLPVFWVKP
jgi:hypothetical protein